MKKKIIGLLFIFLCPMIVFAEQNGWVTIGNDTYYYIAGEMQKGITEIEGKRYLLGVSSGKLYKNGFAEISYGDQKGIYYTNKEGIIQTGFQKIQKDTYYFDPEGRMQKGVTKIEDHYYLLGVSSGKLYTGGLAEITYGDQKGIYLVNSEGMIQTGQHKIGSDKYYFGEDGRMQKGIIEVDGLKYLYGVSSGKLYTGGLAEITYGDQKGIYLVNNEGMIQTGQQKIGSDKYYFGKDGRLQKGIIEVDGLKYLYGVSSGKLYTGGLTEITYGDQKGIYLVNSEGIIQIGFQKVSKDTYYFGEDGRLQKGIVEVEGKKYLLGISSGKLYTGGFAEITYGDQKGKYYTDTEGVIQTGAQTIGDAEYYFDENGRMQKGIVEIDGNRYIYGFVSGKKYYGWATTPDKKIYYTNEEGIIQTGSQQIDGSWYNFNEEGVLDTGWQTINGHQYYFYADGTKAKYIAKIAGVRYEFSANGELEHSNIKVIADLSKHNGVVDWNTLWSSGEVDGVILRIGYSLGMDSMFQTYLAEAKRLKIPYSVYHFTIAENADEATQEANSLLSWYQANSVEPVMGVFYDVEAWEDVGTNSDGITVEMYDTIISTYKNILNENGITMSLYTGKNYAETRLSQYARDQIGWIAHYNNYCEYEGTYRGWQYTSKGHLPGVNGYVDLSIFYY